ncbi:hypothetical protein B0H13DRAFT_2202440 [Mycena leptocephala]|nr:hypothetical protein B0H13DRAFT_2202440 [Mycena leptocephala]
MALASFKFLCPDSTPNLFAFNDACIRASWSALLPLYAAFYSASPPLFTAFLTLDEAASLSGTPPIQPDVAPRPSKRTTILLSSPALLQILLWAGIGISQFHIASSTTNNKIPFLLALSWVYAFLRPLIGKRIVVAPLDLFWLYLLQLGGAGLLLGGAVFYPAGSGNAHATINMVVLVVNAALTCIPLVVVLSLPMALPVTEPVPGGLEPAPEDCTTLFSWITFAWVYPLIRRGTNNTLTEKDVWDLSPTLQSRPVFHKFMQLRRSTLLRSLLASNSFDIVLDAFLSIVSVLLTFAGPVLLNLILQQLEHPVEGGQRLAYLYAFLGFVCQMAKSEADANHFYYGRRASTRIQTELMVAVYDKALKRRDFAGVVDAGARKEAEAKDDEKDTGPKKGAQLSKILNLMSVDASTVSSIPLSIFFLYGAPFELGLCVFLLYRLLGWAAFAGLFFVVISIPLNFLVAKLSVNYEKGIVTARDKRTSVVNEFISSIKFIKFGGAEEKWLKKTNDARDEELGWLFKNRIVQLFHRVTWGLPPLMISVSSFFVYVKQGNELTVATAFTALAVFNMVNVPLSVVPWIITYLLQASVALSRISTFLDEDEVSDDVSTLKTTTALEDDSGLGLVIENGSFKWNEVEVKTDPSAATPNPTPNEPQFELRDISVSFPEGKLTCVVGPTASGKTALLLALLGEMTSLPGTHSKPPKSSRVDENGLMHCCSYAAQTAWLQHASIKDNITFGFPFDEERYQSVLDACALRPDLDILTDGDRTEIGVRRVHWGVTLSGGQKARVALARAVYAWTKYVLLDDPLSAVDSHTARLLFDRLFCGPLLKNRTVVLVTHHIDLFLPANGLGAQYIVRMLDGRIDTQGTVQDLRARGLLDAIKHELPSEAASADNKESDTEAKAASAQPVTKLVEDEEQAKGDVEWRIYKTYLKASSYIVWILVVFGCFFIDLLELGQKFWIKVWGEAYQTTSDSDLLGFILAKSTRGTTGILANSSLATAPPLGFPAAQDQPMFYIGIYALIGVSVTTSTVIFTGIQFWGGLRASRLLFRDLLRKLAYSTFRWFDSTPKGRILNRVGKDISTVDTALSQSIATFTYTLAQLSIAVVTVGVVFPYFLIPASLLSFAYYKLSVGYLHSSRDLRRMEANTRSPIFTGFSELLEGIVTVRAFGVEKRFLSEMYTKVDLTTRLGYNFWLTNRWLLLNFDYLGASAVFITSLLGISSFVPAGLAGICITSAMSFSRTSSLACRFYTSLQVDLNAVERVVNYLEIPQEPPAIIESQRPPAYWPSSASRNDLLVVEDLEVKYAPDLPSVLHRISFSLKARERVGLLGRTGSGKSTLATSLLRFVEPSSGRIFVDGIDISKIGLNDLRTRLTFIPQDATLFSGTIRDNLDPFDEYEDAACRDALHRVHLLNRSTNQSQTTSARATPVAELEGDTSTISGVSTVTELDQKPVITLDTLVSAEGSNFSHGQRQLIALARALLRQSSIIILDEATSSIDFETDQKIQTTIREEFNDSLLLTVAHRIKTVIDYDRLIILDKGKHDTTLSLTYYHLTIVAGKIAEFDTPYNLIQKKDGIFRDMCMKSGTFNELEAAAKGEK